MKFILINEQPRGQPPTSYKNKSDQNPNEGNNSMFRSLIALFAAIAVTLTGFTQPVFAANNTTANFLDNSVIVINGGKNNPVTINSPNSTVPSGNNPAQTFVDSAVDGAIQTAGVVVGGVLACYAIDGVATVFFPPAAAFATLCPTMPTIAGGTTAFAKVAPAIVKAAI